MKHGCVLVADSHPEMLGAVRSLLHDLFDMVVMVADEGSLLAAIPRVRPDLVVLDLSLPVADNRNIAAQCGETVSVGQGHRPQCSRRTRGGGGGNKAGCTGVCAQADRGDGLGGGGRCGTRGRHLYLSWHRSTTQVMAPDYSITKRKEITMVKPLLRMTLVLLPLLFLSAPGFGQQADPLPSWNDGPAKKAILEFVRVTTDKASPKYVPPEQRIATFDQDGTLWVEHPMYTQVVYCLERVPAVVKEKPELKDKEPFKTVLSGDREAIAKLSMKDLEEILAATLSGMTVEEFRPR